MPTLVLTTPTNPGFATWTDSTLIPGAGITVQKGATVVSGTTTLNFIGAGVSVAAGAPGTADVTIGAGGGAVPGGVANSVQINDGVGGFGGDANLLYDGVNLTVATGGSVIDIGQGFITGGANLTVETQAGGTLTLGTAGETVDVIGTNILVNGASGAVGEVLTSGGPGVAPTWQAAGGGAGTLQDAYDLGQSIDVSNATGDLVFASTTNDGTFLLGNGDDLTVTVDTGGGLWTQTSAGISLTANAPVGFGNITLTSANAGSKIETTADGTVTTATATGTLFKASPAINPAVPPAAPAATLDLWGTLLARLEPTGTLDGATVLQYTAFALTAAVALPALGAGSGGRAILVANATPNPLTVTPPVGGAPRARTLSPGGGSVWVWVAGAVNDWICVGWC
jgi:hypothetical protein